MGKSKSKHHSEVEFLRGEVRRLKAELKYCKRCMEKDVEDIDYDDVAPIEAGLCPECGKGHLQVLDLVHVKYMTCDICTYKKKI